VEVDLKAQFILVWNAGSCQITFEDIHVGHLREQQIRCLYIDQPILPQLRYTLQSDKPEHVLGRRARNNSAKNIAQWNGTLTDWRV
jgi:hypothetical protein